MHIFTEYEEKLEHCEEGYEDVRLVVPLPPPNDELVRHEGNEEEDVDSEVDHLCVHQGHRGHAERRHVRQTLLPFDQSLNDVVFSIP